MQINEGSNRVDSIEYLEANMKPLNHPIRCQAVLGDKNSFGTKDGHLTAFYHEEKKEKMTTPGLQDWILDKSRLILKYEGPAQTEALAENGKEGKFHIFINERLDDTDGIPLGHDMFFPLSPYKYSDDIMAGIHILASDMSTPGRVIHYLEVLNERGESSPLEPETLRDLNRIFTISPRNREKWLAAKCGVIALFIAGLVTTVLHSSPDDMKNKAPTDSDPSTSSSSGQNK